MVIKTSSMAHTIHYSHAKNYQELECNIRFVILAMKENYIAIMKRIQYNHIYMLCMLYMSIYICCM